MSFVLHPWQLFFLIECLDRMIFFGQRSLERALKEFVAHYHTERNHQGLGNRIIDPGDEVGKELGDVQGSVPRIVKIG